MTPAAVSVPHSLSAPAATPAISCSMALAPLAAPWATMLTLTTARSANSHASTVSLTPSVTLVPVHHRC